ncbi:MAG TPA: hypothetical protein VMU76_10440 [Acidimicrobiales bacterium]|nr:hypothetical protein [Acidimicrobiales bacterium]
MGSRQRRHRPLSIASSHWRADGGPKTRFPTEGDAAAAASDQSREAGIELGVYRCDFCDGWHMGRSSASTRS